MSDDGGGYSILKDSVEGLAATIAAIAGYIGMMSIGSSKKIGEILIEIRSIRETLEVYRMDDLRYRVDVTNRLLWLEQRRHEQDERERNQHREGGGGDLA